jgi:hypothetical protein
MSGELLTSEEAAAALGISVLTLYDWLAQSDAGTFAIRGRPITIDYFQGGRRGQGRIKLAVAEIERLREAMRVHPNAPLPRRSPVETQRFPGIRVPLGKPS